MTSTLPIALCSIFITIGFLHFYWAIGGSLGKSAAIPEIKGRPAFVPSVLATTFIGMSFLFSAVLVAARSSLFPSHVPVSILAWCCDALAFALCVRAVGDFRLFGFFKRVTGSRFSRLDTLVYSPLCLALSVGVFLVASGYAV